VQWAGETVVSKVQRMRTHIQTLKADLLVVSMLDEVGQACFHARLRGRQASHMMCVCMQCAGSCGGRYHSAMAPMC